MPPSWKFKFDGRILFIGYGSVSRCTLPLIERHFDMPLSRVAVVDAEDRSGEIAPFIAKGVKYVSSRSSARTWPPCWPVSSRARSDSESFGRGQLHRRHGLVPEERRALSRYLHRTLANYYANPKIPEEQRTNYYLRYAAREQARKWPKGATSALITHGANPGLISHLVKEALLEVARRKKLKIAKPKTRENGRGLPSASAQGDPCRRARYPDRRCAQAPGGVRQYLEHSRVLREGSQPAELGWGSHEKRLPRGGHRHKVGPKCAIYLDQPGCVTQVRSWTPIGGPLIGFLITHGESITLSDYLTVWRGGRAIYRPTVHYAYHPCNDAVLSVREMVTSNFRSSRNGACWARKSSRVSTNGRAPHG